MTFALIGILLGECAIVLDIGSRVFGAYARTAPGAAKRMALVVALSIALAAPISALTVYPESTVARWWAMGFGLLGTALFLHFLFPYRWGIRRVTGPGVTETCRQLTDRIVLRSVTAEIEDLPEGLDELTVLALSDLHCNRAAQLDLIRDSLDQLADDELDLVLVLGDLGEKASLLPEIIEVLSRPRSRYGTFCVRGNHDFEGGRSIRIEELVEPTAIALLSNEVYRLPGLDAAIVGFEHPWSGTPLPPATNCRLAIGLTHTPDSITLFPRLGVTIGLAGHTHGGRLRLPLVGPILVPSKYGRFLDRGPFRFGDSLLFIISGFGYSPSSRMPGEIVRLTIRPRRD